MPRTPRHLATGIVIVVGTLGWLCSTIRVRSRNNAARVLSDVAHHHPEIAIPLEPVLRGLDGPTTTDRNKAAAIVDGLVRRPDSGNSAAR